jgi:hypothetical protein
MINIVKLFVIALALSFLVGCGSSEGGGSSSLNNTNNNSDDVGIGLSASEHQAIDRLKKYYLLFSYPKQDVTQYSWLKVYFPVSQKIKDAFIKTLTEDRHFDENYYSHSNTKAYAFTAVNVTQKNDDYVVKLELRDISKKVNIVENNVFLSTFDAIFGSVDANLYWTEFIIFFNGYQTALFSDYSTTLSGEGFSCTGSPEWTCVISDIDGYSYKWHVDQHSISGKSYAYWLVTKLNPYNTNNNGNNTNNNNNTNNGNNTNNNNTNGNNTNNTNSTGDRNLWSANVFDYLPNLPILTINPTSGSAEIRMAFTKSLAAIYMDMLDTDRNFSGGSQSLTRYYPFPDYEQVHNAWASRHDLSDYSYIWLNLNFDEKDGEIYTDNKLYEEAFIPLTGDIIYIYREKFYSGQDFTNVFEAYAANDLIRDRGFTKAMYPDMWEKHDTTKGIYYNFSYITGISGANKAVWKIEKRPYIP